ncbi:putative transport and golgi organization protein 1 [Balamuthia mandrillaris]
MATLMMNNENVAPAHDNVPVSPAAGKATIKPVLIPVAQEQMIALNEAPKQEQVESEELHNEEQEEDEEDLDEEYDEEEEEEDEEEDEEDFDEDADNFGEQSLEVDAPLSFEEESREAIELASSLGLGSTDDALLRVGRNSENRISLTLNKYSQFLNSEAEVAQLYEGLSTEIDALRSALNSGIQKMVQELNVATTTDAIEAARNFMENFLRVVVERSVVHAEYREQTTVSVDDILAALNLLGRPLYYWNQPQAQTKSLGEQIEEAAAADEEREEEDEEYQPMDGDDMDEEFDSDEEEESEASEWNAEEAAASQEEEEVHWFENATFRRLVDVINRWEGFTIAEQGYAALMSSSEDYLNQLFDAAMKSAQYAARPQISHHDIKFAQSMAVKI